jgi:hypothetical protein
MSNVVTPPLPARKPPVPGAPSKFMGGLSSMFPSLPSFTGGSAGPATSGGIGEQGNIGNLNLSIPYKTKSGSLWTTALIGALGLGALWMIRKR